MPLKLELVGQPLGTHTHAYEERDVMLYALSIGAGPDELTYVYEGRGPKVFPTFAVVPSLQPMLDAVLKLDVNLMTLLHGEQEVTWHAPIPPRGEITTEARVEHVWDKGKGAVIVVHSTTTNAKNGKLLFENRSSLFCRGQGGFGGDPGPKAPNYAPPEGVPPTFRDEAPTRPDQALLYRLNGDRNPLHADPAFAEMAGFPQPILHGLCTFGFLARAVVRHVAGGDPARLKRFGGRFTDVVFPGDTLVSEGWEQEGSRYHLRVQTARGTTVISNAFAELA